MLNVFQAVDSLLSSRTKQAEADLIQAFPLRDGVQPEEVLELSTRLNISVDDVRRHDERVRQRSAEMERRQALLSDEARGEVAKAELQELCAEHQKAIAEVNARFRPLFIEQNSIIQDTRNARRDAGRIQEWLAETCEDPALDREIMLARKDELEINSAKLRDQLFKHQRHDTLGVVDWVALSAECDQMQEQDPQHNHVDFWSTHKNSIDFYAEMATEQRSLMKQAADIAAAIDAIVDELLSLDGKRAESRF